MSLVITRKALALASGLLLSAAVFGTVKYSENQRLLQEMRLHQDHINWDTSPLFSNRSQYISKNPYERSSFELAKKANFHRHWNWVYEKYRIYSEFYNNRGDLIIGDSKIETGDDLKFWCWKSLDRVEPHILKRVKHWCFDWPSVKEEIQERANRTVKRSADFKSSDYDALHSFLSYKPLEREVLEDILVSSRGNKAAAIYSWCFMKTETSFTEDNVADFSLSANYCIN